MTGWLVAMKFAVAQTCTHTLTHIFFKCWIQRSILNISSCIPFIVHFKDLHTKGYLSGIVGVFTCNLYIDTSVLVFVVLVHVCVYEIHYNTCTHQAVHVNVQANM